MLEAAGESPEAGSVSSLSSVSHILKTLNMKKEQRGHEPDKAKKLLHAEGDNFDCRAKYQGYKGIAFHLLEVVQGGSVGDEGYLYCTFAEMENTVAGMFGARYRDTASG